jgi:hypothetical protein
MVVYLSVCGNTLRQYTKRGKGQFTCQCVAMLLAEMLHRRKGSLHIDVWEHFNQFYEEYQGMLGCQCVGTLLNGTLNTTGIILVSARECFYQIGQEGGMVVYLPVYGNTLRDTPKEKRGSLLVNVWQ